MSGFHEIVQGGEVELVHFMRGRQEADHRLSSAMAMCDAAANQPMVVQAQASIDLENARAAASEWGLVSIAGDLEREVREGPGAP